MRILKKIRLDESEAITHAFQTWTDATGCPPRGACIGLPSNFKFPI
jgi:hypothetical protein